MGTTTVVSISPSSKVALTIIRTKIRLSLDSFSFVSGLDSGLWAPAELRTHSSSPELGFGYNLVADWCLFDPYFT